MALAQKETYGSMFQNREPRNKPHIYGQFISGKGGKSIQWGKVSSVTGVGKPGQQYIYINEFRTHPLTIHKNKIKMF